MSSSSSKNSNLYVVLELLGTYIDSIDFSTLDGRRRCDEATEKLCQKLDQDFGGGKVAYETLKVVCKIDALRGRIEESLSQKTDDLVEKYEKVLAANEEKSNEAPRRWIASVIVTAILIVVLIVGINRWCLGGFSIYDCLGLFLFVSIPCAIWYVIVKDSTLIDWLRELGRRNEKQGDDK